ncbi:MAG TPA: hypothetical protein VF173_28590 [Thermoanaerobaculia bacterium]|nr:hypothetical protein [Thermoanaerobaculia bacterium]
MRPLPAFVPQPRSFRCWSRVLLLGVLLMVLGVAAGMAQVPAAEIPQAHAPATGEVGEFLATLAPAPAGDQAPAPEFLQTSVNCTSDAQCPPDKLCCKACAFPGCTLMRCLTPMNGHCPLIP